MDKASDIDIYQTMISWTREPGYPLLKITILNWSENVLKISVRKTKYSTDQTEIMFDRNVPIFYRTSSDSSIQARVLIDEITAMEFPTICTKYGWINFNVDG